MRLLHVASEYPPQQVFGLGRYVCDLARAQAALGHDVHVLTNSIAGRDQEVCDAGVHVHRVDHPPPPKPPGSVAPALAFNTHLYARTLALPDLTAPTVVVSHDWLTAPAGHELARRWGVPHVQTVHDLVIGKRLGALDHAEDLIVRDIERWTAVSADLLLANSRAIAAELVDQYGADPDRIVGVPCGIDPGRFAASLPAGRAQAFRRALAADADLLITFVGRLDAEKGVEVLLRACASVRAQLPHIRVALIGRGSLGESLAALVQDLGLAGCVDFHGYLASPVLEQVYRVSDIHVCPSLYEPFGIVAAEAMAAGAPVIVSGTGGLLDIVGSDAVGLRVPPGDPQRLAAGILRLAGDQDLRRRIAAAGRAHVTATFAWPVIATTALAAYQRACATPRCA